MKYRKYGKTDWMISELSIGVLRLEEVVADQGGADRAERMAALRFAIDNGVNYINLGYPLYFDDPEAACSYVKEALGGGYREKVKVAINIQSRGVASQQDLDSAVEEQLRLFGLNKADFCIVDWVYRATWAKLLELDVAGWARQTIASGKADHIGFAFHDDAYYLKEIYEAYADWSLMQIELSLVDYKHHPGAGGLKFALEYQNAVIATDCTKAGRLLNHIPDNVQMIWNQAKPPRTPAEWCVRWVLNFTEVSSVLLDPASVEEVKEYLSYAEHFAAGDVDVWETLQATKVREAYYAARFFQCTACRCCMPCALGVDAPRIVELYNDGLMYGDDRIPRFLFNLEKHQDIACSHCLRCVTQCPKHFPLSDLVAKAHSKYNSKTANIHSMKVE